MAEAPDLQKLMRMAQEMQTSMKKAHDELSRQKYEGSAGGGLVKVTMNGSHYTESVYIDPKVRDEEEDILADLIAAANNAAVREIEKASEKKMLDLTKQLGIPGEGKE